MTISVIIPVYNERTTILETISRVRAAPVAKKIIVIDDASDDGPHNELVEGHALFCGMRWPHRIFNSIAAILTNLLYRAGITDEATCYKVFRTDILRAIPLTCQRFEFCPEVTAKIRKRGLHSHEVPVSYQARSVGAGKKIRWWDGVIALWTLIKFRFTD